MPYLIDFPEATRTIARPEGWEETQCAPARVHVSPVDSGPNEGIPQYVTCWQLTPEDVEAINANGGKVYVQCLGGLPPHAVHATFETIRQP